MKNLELQSTSKKQLDQFIKNPSHALLLHGRFGVGLGTLAQAIAQAMTSRNSIITIQPDEKGVIKISTIRQLYKQTRTKKSEVMVIIIDDADIMGQPAQNALLKLLEEPPAHTRFILTSHTPQLLLSTVRSRTQEIPILPISRVQNKKFIEKLEVNEPKKIAQITYIAEGLPAEITRLSGSGEYFDARSLSVRKARDFLQSLTYKKLVQSYAVGNDRAQALALLRDISHITEMSIKQKPSRELAGLLNKIIFTEEKLLADGNIRSQLLRLAIN